LFLHDYIIKVVFIVILGDILILLIRLSGLWPFIFLWNVICVRFLIDIMKGGAWNIILA